MTLENGDRDHDRQRRDPAGQAVDESEISDVAGYPSPEVTVTGTGKAWVLRDGQLIVGTWERASEGDLTVFTTKQGERDPAEARHDLRGAAPRRACSTRSDRPSRSRPPGLAARVPAAGWRVLGGTLVGVGFSTLSEEGYAVERETGTFRVKSGLAEMLKGGVIMDVTTAEQAKIAEDAGACAVMALERVPADIRRDGGVARMADPTKVEEIMAGRLDPGDGQGAASGTSSRRRSSSRSASTTSTSPRCSRRPTRSTTSTSGQFTVPFVCGARNLGEALRRIAEGAAMIRTKGEAGTGNVVEAVRHVRTIIARDRGAHHAPARAARARGQGAGRAARARADGRRAGKLPVVNFSAGGIATPADAALMMQLGVDGIFVGSGIFKSEDPAHDGAGDRRGDDALQGPRHPGEGLARPRRPDGRASRSATLENRLQDRGW